MTWLSLVGWFFAFLTLTGAVIFFWRKEKVAGLSFLITFIVILAGISEKRVVLTSAMLGLTFERDPSSELRK